MKMLSLLHVFYFHFYYLRQRRAHVIAGVYLSVRLLARLRKKLKTDFAEIFREG